MIRYPIASRRAVARLMRAYNDIDVFVEDSSYVGVYATLVNRALSGRAAVKSVTALGPKSIVERHALEDIDPGGRPRLYIVDGDIELISRLRQKSAKHLYRLNVYSLENLVFEKAGCMGVAKLSLPGKTEEQVERALEYDGILSEIDRDLAFLYIIYAVASRLGIVSHHFRNDSFGISLSVTSRIVSVDRAAVRRRILLLIRDIAQQKGTNRYRVARGSVVRRVRSRSLDGRSFVPAKEFHLKYLVGRLGAAGGSCLPQSAVVAYLAEHCTFANDPRFARRLRKVARKSEGADAD